MNNLLCALALMIGLSGCSALQLQKAQAVVVKVEAGAKTAIVTGCKDLPAIEVALNVVEEFVPANATVTAVEIAVKAGEKVADSLCAKVAALQAVPVVAPIQ